MEKLKLRSDKAYIIGVSGGPDSMALFDMCREQGIPIIAAHMNYQKRASADRDMLIIRKYCDKYGIAFEVRMQNKQCVGNFQAFARQERYAFYKELVDIYHAEGVLLAHHFDDHLETYLMQKQRKCIGTYYGIQEETQIMGCRILRPLLHRTKLELEEYCTDHEVVYGIDESNLTCAYTRNKIRHEVLEHMSRQEKETLANVIQQENEKLLRLQESVQEFLSTWNRDLDSIRTLDSDMLQQVLIQWIFAFCHCHLPQAQIAEVAYLIRNKAGDWTKDIRKQYYIYSEYGKLCMDSKADVNYIYTYNSISYEKTAYFELSSQGSNVEALTLYDSDFPIVIRNARKFDEIALRFGTKKLNRWFIDRKIPKKMRKTWPVVENASGKVILVPKIGCDIEHFSNNPTLFVLK